MLLLGIAVVAWRVPPTLVRDAAAYVFARSPHERYAASLRLRGAAAAPAGQAWLAAADSALSTPEDVRAPFTDAGVLDLERPSAVSWRMDARRGQRVVADVEFGGGRIFVDLFRDGELVASASREERRLVYNVNEDGALVLRIQPELAGGGAYRVVERSEASMRFPVQGMTPRAVQSSFGASRDEGRRSHEGVDIFAKRGTPVLAASDGWVAGSTTNGLGGNVVWVWSPLRQVRAYYAHLDRHAVSPGERVRVGDVLGYVGTTGNARGGPPHLHFGIYATGKGSVDPLPYICDAPCGARR